VISTDQIRAALPLALGDTNLPLAGKRSGKVRDWYPLGEGRRLIVTTDRLSAFDRILTRVPFKGQVLNQLALWWFARTADVVANHALAVPDPNALVAVDAEPFPVEVVVRGYITGVTSTALWHRYALGEREIYGYRFPDGLRENEALPEPIITPTTKGGPTGHDERLTHAEVVEKGLLDARTWELVQALALALFQRGQELALRAGLILVDAEYEFGRLSGPDGESDESVLLIDEVHTPDSARFWEAGSYPERFFAGEEPESLDKEFVRRAYAREGYRGDGPPPAMPVELWISASQRYIMLYEMLTGQAFEPGAYPIQPRLIENLRKAQLIQ